VTYIKINILWLLIFIKFVLEVTVRGKISEKLFHKNIILTITNIIKEKKSAKYIGKDVLKLWCDQREIGIHFYMY